MEQTVQLSNDVDGSIEIECVLFTDHTSYSKGSIVNRNIRFRWFVPQFIRRWIVRKYFM